MDLWQPAARHAVSKVSPISVLKEGEEGHWGDPEATQTTCWWWQRKLSQYLSQGTEGRAGCREIKAAPFHTRSASIAFLAASTYLSVAGPRPISRTGHWPPRHLRNPQTAAEPSSSTQQEMSVVNEGPLISCFLPGLARPLPAVSHCVRGQAGTGCHFSGQFCSF